MCMDELGSVPEMTIYVGNSEEDVLAAQAAHCLDVLLNRGEYIFPAVKPTVTIMSLYQLKSLIHH